NVETTQQQESHLTFLNGLFIQLLNPKAILVILPVTTIMYPAAKITGIMILIVSLLISLGAVGAPFTYALVGKVLGNKIANPIWFNRLNKLMGILLILSGLFMFKDFLNGINLL
ncbi:LysE family translocator, partial [Acinetobacter baumannii]|nr:LysE family translocator [Acinetobacter baumannii]